VKLLRLDYFASVVQQISAASRTTFRDGSKVSFAEMFEIPPMCGYRRKTWRLDSFAVSATDYFIPLAFK
jgi:hypothetical protein